MVQIIHSECDIHPAMFLGAVLSSHSGHSIHLTAQTEVIGLLCIVCCILSGADQYFFSLLEQGMVLPAFLAI